MANGAVRVLCVDDNTDAADTTGDLLRLSGFDVRVCHDGPSAVAAAREFAPAVCVVDLTMPGMDGFEVARQVTADAGPSAPRLVALTALWDIATQHKTHNAGFVAHLVKPVEPDKLRKVIHEAAGFSPVG